MKYYDEEVSYGMLKFLNKWYLLLLLFYYLGLFNYVIPLFGASGVYGHEFLTSVARAVVTYDYDTHTYWQVLSDITDDHVIYGFYFLLIGMLTLSLANVLPVVTGIVALILHCLFAVRTNPAYWGWGFMITPFLIYTFFGLKKTSGSIWPMRLLQLNVATLYLHIVLHRIGDVSWLNGHMLYETLNQSMFLRFNFDLEPYIGFFRGLTYLALAIEVVAPFCLIFGFFRKPVIFFLILFHLALEILTNVGFWNFMLIPTLMVFLPQGDQERILKKVVRA